MAVKNILASPNWYNSIICDISLDGTLAFGGRNTIFLIDITHEDFSLQGQLIGHGDRVSCVQFSKAVVYSRLCVSGSDDHMVMIWDIDSRNVIYKHSNHEVNITAVSWSCLTPDWIISGDEGGQVLSWNHKLNHVYQHMPMNGRILCISCSPEEEGLVVIGYKTGQILVVSLRNERHDVICLLKGHDDEIHSLTWSPVKSGCLSQGIFGVSVEHDGFILASGARDKTIKFWHARNSQFIATVYVPTRASSRKSNRDEHQQKTRLWNTLCWSATDPSCLLSSGYSGDILAWDLSKTCKQKWQLFGGNSRSRHNRIVFNISQYSAKDILITTSMDRIVNIWSYNKSEVLHSIPTLGGFVYSMATSLIDSSSVALAVGDNMIRILQTESYGGPYQVKSHWRGIGSKVMKVVWHPMKEGILAFGTEEGKVGVYNVHSQTSSVFRTYHKKSVYSLSWGPPTGSKVVAKIYHLYSCGGEGTVFEHQTDNYGEAAKNIDNLLKTTNEIKHNIAGHSEVSWKSDSSILAIGNEDGSVHICRATDLLILLTINVHQKSITCLSWYWYNKKDLNSWYLASSSNGFDIHIHDLRSLDQNQNGSEKTVVTTSFQKLVGHNGRVTNIAWCPHVEFRIASSSYDGSVQIWDVLTGEGLANYREHNGRVMSVVWSITDCDVLCSGGEDFTVRCWKVSETQFKQPPIDVKTSKSKSKKKKKKMLSKTDSQKNVEADILSTAQPGEVSLKNGALVDSEVSNSIEDVYEEDGNEQTMSQSTEHDFVDESNSSLKFLLSSDSKASRDVTSESEPTFSVKGEMKKKKKKVKSLFPLCANADNKSKSITSKECVEVAKYMHYINSESRATKELSETTINLGLFTTRTAALDMLTKEGIHHGETGNVDYQWQLEIWKGNIGGVLEQAVEKRQLSEWLVGLSHLAGEQVQQAVCEAFAEQLANQGSYHKAALYYLGCHKVFEAVHMFHECGMYREAITLAKARLLPQDPILLDLYTSWARKLENDASYEQAAKCYLACDLKNDAIRVLTRRDDESSLAAAAEVARISGKTDISTSLILRWAICVIRCARWNDALNKLHNFPDMQAVLMVLHTHESLLTSLKQYSSVVHESFPECQSIEDNRGLSQLPIHVHRLKDSFNIRRISECSLSKISETWLVSRILKNWWDSGEMGANHSDLHRAYIQVSVLPFKKLDLAKQDIPDLCMSISKELCLGLIAVLIGKHDVCIEHFLKAIVLCYNVGNMPLLRHFFAVLFPFGFESWHMISQLSVFSSDDTEEKCNEMYFAILAYFHRALVVQALDELRTTSVNKDVEGITDARDKDKDYLEKPVYDVQAADEVITIGENKDDQTPLNKNTTSDFTLEDIYRLALLSSNILLNEHHGNVQRNSAVGESIRNVGNLTNKTKIDSQFPVVAESSCLLLSLCSELLKTRSVYSDKTVALARQILSWTTNNVENEENISFFDKTRAELSKYCEC